MITGLSTVVAEIQRLNSQLILCGSVALIFADMLDRSCVGDIDFVVNKKDCPRLRDIYSLRKDKYVDNVDDNYESYHGVYDLGNEMFDINLLVFDDDIKLEIDTITYLNKTVNIQKIDTILNWKKKYNRSKDIEDLNKIANKCLEEILED